MPLTWQWACVKEALWCDGVIGCRLCHEDDAPQMFAFEHFINVTVKGQITTDVG
jgi:hypothetical protein